MRVDGFIIAHFAGKSYSIFRAAAAGFPLRETADYAIIDLLLKTRVSAAMRESLAIAGFQAREPIAQ